MATYDRIAELPLELESVALEGLELQFPGFLRQTTLIHLSGGGETGIGEDVVYDGHAHDVLQAAHAPLAALAGSYTIASFSRRLDDAHELLWPEPPEDGTEAFIDYRRWAFESAALDLALRQAGRSLADLLGREPRPLHYVVSMRLTSPAEGEPETAERVYKLLGLYPGTGLKLDPTNTWTPDLIGELAATGAVNSLDLKGMYKNTPVDVETDPELYARCIAAFPDAWYEDPDVTDETRPLLEPVSGQVTWDAPIHSVADVLERPWKPRMVNIKPSRFGPLTRLFEMYDWCEREGVQAYGGGQTELGVGRGHIQYLASLFHPDTPNDTAPGGFNLPELPDGLPGSPLEPRIDATGFRWV
jgi:L-alanine-DL-glutamate epimerase-like enolase superfamily enzyme